MTRNGTPTDVRDLKHGDRMDVYEINGDLLYPGALFTDAYYFHADVSDFRIPLNIRLEELDIIVQFWVPQNQDFAEIGVGQRGKKRQFHVTGHDVISSTAIDNAKLHYRVVRPEEGYVQETLLSVDDLDAAPIGTSLHGPKRRGNRLSIRKTGDNRWEEYTRYGFQPWTAKAALDIFPDGWLVYPAPKPPEWHDSPIIVRDVDFGNGVVSDAEATHDMRGLWSASPVHGPVMVRKIKGEDILNWTHMGHRQ